MPDSIETQTNGSDDDPILAEALGWYHAGVFPMADLNERVPPGGAAPIYLFKPDHRGILPLEDGALRVTRSLRQRVRAARFEITADTAFGRVIDACASDRTDGNWIDPQIRFIYTHLHEVGVVHSIEAWFTGDQGERQLVGGLYGVATRGLFAGESMFSRPQLGGTDASKVCLVHLWHHLRARGFRLLDCQYHTPHLGTLGVTEISADQYEQRLAEALTTDPGWGTFDASIAPAP